MAASIVEEGVRLSRSRLWRLQRAFFERRGAQAWSRGTVPHYVTSNPYIAQAYARVTLGWLRDCVAGAGPGWPAIDPGEPIHVVELGAGSGRFAYHFLRALQRMLPETRLAGLRVRYVMTDFADEIVDGWRGLAPLAPFIDAGLLDVARFDVERDRALHLRHAGATLAPGTVRNPVAVIANYLFDSVPQDAFEIRDGALHERLVTLSVPAADDDHVDLDDPALLERLEVDYEHRPAPAPYYDDPALDHALCAHDAALEGSAFLFPAVGLGCLGRLAELAGERLLLLSGDKGYGKAEQLASRDGTRLARHGSFSMMVNYHAIGRWFIDRGGVALRLQHRHRDLCVSAFALGAPAGGHVETAHAFEEAIGHQGPDDFFTVRQRVRKHYDAMELGELLAWMRWCEWDPTAMLDAWQAVVDRLPTATADEGHELHAAIHRIWGAYLPIGEARDLPFALGALLAALGHDGEALAMFARSLAQHGDDARTYAQIAMCLARLERLDEALAIAERSLALAPIAEVAALRDELRAALAARR